MRLSSSNLLALLAITALTDALPFIPKPRSNRPLMRRKATYSVVPIDGGSTGAAAATTVTEPASTLPPVTETQLSTLVSTLVVTAYEAPSTVVVTITPIPSPPQSKSTAVSTSAPSCSEITTITTLNSASTIYTISTTTTTSATTEVLTTTSVTTPAAVVSVTTLSPAVITATASPSSVPYDNGIWHTTYYHPVYETSSSSSSSYSEASTASFYPYPSTMTTSSTASPSLATNIGIPWNGTWALGPRDMVKTPAMAISAPTRTTTMYHPTTENE